MKMNRMKKLATAALGLAALVMAGFFLYEARRDGPSPYRTAPVERGDIVEAVTATGNLNAVKTVQVGSQVSGTIQSLAADYNSQVKKGQIIATIDPRLFQAAVVQARGNVASARAALERAEILAADARRTLAQNEKLAQEGFVARSDLDAARTAYEAAEAQKRTNTAQLDQALGNASVAEANLAYTTIRSPVDGIVVSRNVDVGQTVAASFQTPTLFTIAQDLSRMQIDTNVDEADIGKVAAGQAAVFTVDAYPEKSFTGRVVQVRSAPIVTQNVVTYNAVIQVDNRDLLLKPGMTANVSIEIRRVGNVLKIPNAALRYRPPSRAGAGERNETGKKPGNRRPGAATVYVIGKDGGPAAVPIAIGVTDGASTQIVSGTLSEGELLITAEARKAPAERAGGGPPGMRGFH